MQYNFSKNVTLTLNAFSGRSLNHQLSIIANSTQMKVSSDTIRTQLPANGIVHLNSPNGQWNDVTKSSSTDVVLELVLQDVFTHPVYACVFRIELQFPNNYIG
jgi:hypothetical protein